MRVTTDGTVVVVRRGGVRLPVDFVSTPVARKSEPRAPAPKT